MSVLERSGIKYHFMCRSGLLPDVYLWDTSKSLSILFKRKDVKGGGELCDHRLDGYHMKWLQGHLLMS